MHSGVFYMVAMSERYTGTMWLMQHTWRILDFLRTDFEFASHSVRMSIESMPPLEMQPECELITMEYEIFFGLI